MKSTLILTIGLALPVLFLSGCSKPDTQRNANTDALRQQKADADYQNNPHVPPQAKAAMQQYEQSRQTGRPQLKK